MAFPQHLPAEKANLALRLIPPNGPWVSFDLELDPEKDPELNVIKGPLDVSENWQKYPGTPFRNWTRAQVERSGLAAAIRKKNESGTQCIIHQLDINQMGRPSEP